eukprot:3071006-Rhodomonas_salina.1
MSAPDMASGTRVQPGQGWYQQQASISTGLLSSPGSTTQPQLVPGGYDPTPVVRYGHARPVPGFA